MVQMAGLCHRRTASEEQFGGGHARGTPFQLTRLHVGCSASSETQQLTFFPLNAQRCIDDARISKQRDAAPRTPSCGNPKSYLVGNALTKEVDDDTQVKNCT